jgi:WG containing repeat
MSAVRERDCARRRVLRRLRAQTEGDNGLKRGRGMKLFCTSCGIRLEADARFCESCGLPIAPTAGTPQGVGDTTLRKVPAKFPKLPAIVLGLALIVGLGLAIAEFVLPGHPLSTTMSRLTARFATGPAASYLYMVSRDGRWGYVDSGGDVAIPLVYDEPPRFVSDSNQRSFFIRQQPPFPVFSAGRWWLVDRQGSRISQESFDDVRSSLQGSSMCMRKGDRWGCVGPNGQTVVEFKYKRVWYVGAGRLAFSHGSKEGDLWGLLDDKGVVLKEPTFLYAPFFLSHPDVAMARFPDGSNGLIDRTGVEVSSRRFKLAAEPSGDVWPVKTEAGWAYSDLRGELRADRRLDPSIETMRSAYDGRYFAATAAGWGLLNLQGTWVVKPQAWLDSPRGCWEVRCIFGPTAAAGVTDASGQLVLPKVYGLLSAFRGGAAIAEFEGQRMLIDVNGAVVWPKGLHSHNARAIKSSDIIAARWKPVREIKHGKQTDLSTTDATLEYSGELVRRTTNSGASEVWSWRVSDEPDGSIMFGANGKVQARQVGDVSALMSSDGTSLLLRRIGASDSNWAVGRSGATLPPGTLFSGMLSGGALSDVEAEAALRKFSSAVTRVIGVQEIKDQNSAIADFELQSITYKSCTFGCSNRNYSGPAKGFFVKYTNGRWVLKRVQVPNSNQLEGYDAWTLDIPARQ